MFLSLISIVLYCTLIIGKIIENFYYNDVNWGGNSRVANDAKKYTKNYKNCSSKKYTNHVI